MNRQEQENEISKIIIVGSVSALVGALLMGGAALADTEHTKSIHNTDGTLNASSNRFNILNKVTHQIPHPISGELIEAYRISWVDWGGINVVNLQAIDLSAQFQALDLISQKCTVLQTIDQDQQNGTLKQYLILSDPACLKN